MKRHCHTYELYRLPEIVDSKLIRELRRRYEALASRGNLFHIVDVNDANPHRPETPAALISILRSVRGHGGEVRIVASRKEVRRMLGVTALDRIFNVFASESDARQLRSR
jgi:hypothetical protein